MKSVKHSVGSRLVGALLGLLGAGGAWTAQATQSVEMTEEQAIRRSARVMHGTVEGVRSFWNPQGTQIWTAVDLRVHEYWKGWQATDRVTIHHLGGTVGDLTFVIVDQPEFQVGEEVVVLLERLEGAVLPYTGMSRGKRTVDFDPAAQVEVLRETGATLAGYRAEALRVAALQRAEALPQRRELERALGAPIIDFDAVAAGEEALPIEAAPDDGGGR